MQALLQHEADNLHGDEHRSHKWPYGVLRKYPTQQQGGPGHWRVGELGL
jgi:hypothetical protein